VKSVGRTCIAVLLVLGASGVSLASEQTGVTANTYVVLGGGANLSFSGFGEGFYPAAQAGIGYRCGRVEFEADFLFSTIEWKRGALGYPEDPPAYRYVPGQLFGLMAGIRVYPYSFENSAYPYAIAGIGARVINIDGDYDEESGAMIGLALRAGIGFEVRVTRYWFVDVEAAYLHTEFFDNLDYTSPDNAGGFSFALLSKLHF
jgi:hypothetical protein